MIWKRLASLSILVSILFSLIAVTGLNQAQPATAALFLNESRIELTDLPVTENVYATGEVITISTDVEGDIIALGSRVIIEGNVVGNVIVAAAEVQIDGFVAGDVFIAAGNTVINSDIDGDLRIIAGNAYLNSELINGDKIVSAANLYTNPGLDFAGAERVSAGTEVHSEIRDVRSISSPTWDFNFNIDRNQEVASPEWGQILGGAAFAVFIEFLRFLGAILAIFILVKLFPVKSAEIVKFMRSRKKTSLKSTALGLGLFLFGPLLILGLALTVIGAQLAGLLMLAGIVALVIGKMYPTLTIGEIITSRLELRQRLNIEKSGQMLPITVGVTTLALIGLIPFLGALTVGFINLWGFGALAHHKYHMLRKK